MPNAKNVQVARIQQVIRQTVPDAIRELSRYGTTAVCSSSGVRVSFDRAEPSSANLGRHARKLKAKAAQVQAA